jgi:hypothetical protein
MQIRLSRRARLLPDFEPSRFQYVINMELSRQKRILEGAAQPKRAPPWIVGVR